MLFLIQCKSYYKLEQAYKSITINMTTNVFKLFITLQSELRCELRRIILKEFSGTHQVQKGGLIKKIIEKLYKNTLRRSKKVFFQNPEDLELFIKSKI